LIANSHYLPTFSVLNIIARTVHGNGSEPEKPEKPNDPEIPTWGPKVTPYENKDSAILEFGQALNGGEAKLASFEPVIGDVIYVCGSPYGADFFNTVTKGILSGKNRTSDRGLQVAYYQTDAAVLPGNSGGPWFNDKGEIVAISSAWVPSSGTVGMGIPLPELKKIVEKI